MHAGAQIRYSKFLAGTAARRLAEHRFARGLIVGFERMSFDSIFGGTLLYVALVIMG